MYDVCTEQCANKKPFILCPSILVAQSTVTTPEAPPQPSSRTLKTKVATTISAQASHSNTLGVQREMGRERKPTCIDPDGGVSARGAVDRTGYGKAHKRTEREDGEVHPRATPYIGTVSERDHRHRDEARKHAGRHTVEKRERNERACAA